MSFRLTKDLKILKPGDYSLVFSKGRMIRGKYWQVMTRPAQDKPRLGLAISKKAHRLAVDRNRLKRIAREVFRLTQQQLSITEFVVMSRGKTADNKTLSSDLEHTLKQAANH